MDNIKSKFSAAKQGLGYLFQSRLALLQALSCSEEYSVLIECNDDVELRKSDGKAFLMSLKHKADGDALTDLSIDFWKSVRVWLSNYKQTGFIASKSRYQLFSTAEVSSDSFLKQFENFEAVGEQRAKDARKALEKSKSDFINNVNSALAELDELQLADFYSRITIFSCTPRISDIPALIKRYLITIRSEFHDALFERLEGWWSDLVIQTLTGQRVEPIKVQELRDQLAVLADDYKIDNLPIEFTHKLPESGIDAVTDKRCFVEQLRSLNLSTDRIRYAIIDYYRAFEQRSSWARANLLVSDEIERYEDKLVEEWGRYKAFVCESITAQSQEDACIAAGRELYLWAEQSTGQLRIRERVVEQYVVRGTFHILANGTPVPRVHWHPRFLDRLATVLGVAA